MNVCAYNRRPSDKRTRCRKPATHTVYTVHEGMSVTVCDAHLATYTTHGWHEREAR